MLLLVSITMTAQKDVTKFLGIPVDGYKAEMRTKLIAKGFTYNRQYDYLEGEFNGRKVTLSIATNNNKVYRIMLIDANACSETDIKIRFNNLCRQFAKNKKYVPSSMDVSEYIIPDDEDISYEMIAHNKRYEAAFNQVVDTNLIDAIAARKMIMDAVLQEYTQEQIDNPTEEQAKDISFLAEEKTKDYLFELMEKKLVWFMISEKYGEYRIILFYDNEYNHSDGEDL